nr:hypothetical protein [Tanacetum cinerariifolium]
MVEGVIVGADIRRGATEVRVCTSIYEVVSKIDFIPASVCVLKLGWINSSSSEACSLSLPFSSSSLSSSSPSPSSPSSSPSPSFHSLSSPSSLVEFQEISSSDSSMGTLGTPVASFSYCASVMATSERVDRLLDLEALAACFPFSEVVSLGPAAVVRGVIVVSEILLAFQTLALGLGGDGDDDDKDDDGEEGDDDDDQEDDGDDDEDDEEKGNDNEQASDEEEFIHPSLSTHTEEKKGRRKEEGHDEEEEEEEDELYKDVNIYQGRGIQMTQEFKDSHVTIPPINPDGQ